MSSANGKFKKIPFGKIFRRIGRFFRTAGNILQRPWETVSKAAFISF
jgi:hypothetical protein